MRTLTVVSVSFKTGIAALFFMLTCLAAFAQTPQYLVTDDDNGVFTNSGVSFYTIGAGGSLQLDTRIPTGGAGISGGFFGASRVVTLNSGTLQCVYSSEALTGDVVGINVNTLAVGGSAFGSPTDSGNANGIGLAVNSQYLYASFTTSNTIGTFQVQPGCGLTFVSDISVVGLQGGFIDGMAIQGNIMVATYGDGSIESFNISSGIPVSNGDKQNSTGTIQGAFATYPTSIEITQDGHYALFGDTSTSMVVEVSDISSGKLAKTISYTLAGGISSSNIMLSPDETLLYISNTQGDTVSAAFFNAATGALSAGCTSGSLNGYVTNWSYLASLAVDTNIGTGSVVYAAEFGTASGIAMISVTSANGKCTLTEMAGSPVSDPNSAGLLSIGMYPPRGF